MGSSVHSVTVGGRLQALYIASKLPLHQKLDDGFPVMITYNLRVKYTLLNNLCDSFSFSRGDKRMGRKLSILGNFSRFYQAKKSHKNPRLTRIQKLLFCYTLSLLRLPVFNNTYEK